MFRYWGRMIALALSIIGGVMILHAQAHFIEAEVVSVPAVLETSAVQTVRLVPPLTGLYDVGLRVDQKAAMARFPCAVDMRRQFTTPCPDTDLRVKAKLTFYDEKGSSFVRTADVEVRGGRYGGSDTFSFDLINPELKKDKSYRLSILYEEWTPGFEALKPDLVVAVNTLDGKSKLMGYTLESLLGQVILMLGG